MGPSRSGLTARDSSFNPQIPGIRESELVPPGQHESDHVVLPLARGAAEMTNAGLTGYIDKATFVIALIILGHRVRQELLVFGKASAVFGYYARIAERDALCVGERSGRIADALEGTYRRVTSENSDADWFDVIVNAAGWAGDSCVEGGEMTSGVTLPPGGLDGRARQSLTVQSIVQIYVGPDGRLQATGDLDAVSVVPCWYAGNMLRCCEGDLPRQAQEALAALES